MKLNKIIHLDFFYFKKVPQTLFTFLLYSQNPQRWNSFLLETPQSWKINTRQGNSYENELLFAGNSSVLEGGIFFWSRQIFFIQIELLEDGICWIIFSFNGFFKIPLLNWSEALKRCEYLESNWNHFPNRIKKWNCIMHWLI